MQMKHMQQRHIHVLFLYSPYIKSIYILQLYVYAVQCLLLAIIRQVSACVSDSLQLHGL